MKYLLITLLFAVNLCANEYKAKIIDVYDADTVTALVSLGLDVTKLEKVRLLGIDAPELNTEEGKKAQAFLEKRIKNRIVLLMTEDDKREKYGRLLAVLILDGQNVNDMLIKHNYAREYHGGAR
jgi:micrococcal nuclease